MYFSCSFREAGNSTLSAGFMQELKKVLLCSVLTYAEPGTLPRRAALGNVLWRGCAYPITAGVGPVPLPFQCQSGQEDGFLGFFSKKNIRFDQLHLPFVSTQLTGTAGLQLIIQHHLSLSSFIFCSTLVTFSRHVFTLWWMPGSKQQELFIFHQDFSCI